MKNIFGLSSLIAAFMYAQQPFDYTFQNPLVSILPRVIFAAVAFFVVLGLKWIQKKNYGTIINFILVSLVSLLFILVGIVGLHSNTNWPLLLIIILGVVLLVLLIGGYAFFLFKSKNKHLAYVPSSMIISTLIHSFLVLTLVAIIKPAVYGGGDIFYTILTIVGYNSVVEALAAVTVPSLVNTAFNPGILSKFTFLYSSSSANKTVPFLVTISTGTISSLNLPAAQAAA